jgi:hypothetical protein
MHDTALARAAVMRAAAGVPLNIELNSLKRKGSIMNTYELRAGTRAMLAALPLLLAALTATTPAVAQVAPANPTRSAVTLVISGTVGGTAAISGSQTAAQEAVAFDKAGVEIGSTLSRNSDPALPPVLIVDITFLKAAGVGLVTKSKFTAQAGNSKLLPFASSYAIPITFPFNLDKAPFTDARSGLATFHLTFDTNGVITGATGSIDSNTF